MQRFSFLILVLASALFATMGAPTKAHAQESQSLAQPDAELSYQLDSPTLELPQRTYRWGVAVFVTGIATTAIGALSYGLSGYCDDVSCEGRGPNGLLLIPTFGGLALLTAGIVGWIVGKIRYNSAMRAREHVPLGARAW